MVVKRPHRRPVLTYKDEAGALMRVYADHAVARPGVEAQVLKAKGHADVARVAGGHADEEGRRAAVEGRWEAQAAVLAAASAREASRRAAQEGRREAELGKQEAARGRVENDAAIKEA